MNYFLDFEATQYSEEIISIGCIRENCERFYSLARPSKMKKMTDFITKLTHITIQDLENAPTADEAFSAMFDWVFPNEVMDMNAEAPTFYVWGNKDIDFLRATGRKCFSLKARLMIGCIIGTLVDYSAFFKRRMKLKEQVSLLKVTQCINKDAFQVHNALDDARMLKLVYDNFNVNPTWAKERFSEIIKERKRKTGVINDKDRISLPKGTICIVNNKGEIIKSFASVEEGRDYVISQIEKNNTKMTDKGKKKVLGRVLEALRSNQKFYGGLWRRIS